MDNEKSYVSRAHAEAKRDIKLIVDVLQSEGRIAPNTGDRIRNLLHSIQETPFGLLAELAETGATYEFKKGNATFHGRVILEAQTTKK